MNDAKDKKDGLQVRIAEKQDVPLILAMIRKLAAYEKRPEAVSAKESALQYWLFERAQATVLLGEWAGQTVAYAILYPVFGSFAARCSLYVEDLYVDEALRGRGFGRRMMAEAAAVGVAMGCSGMEWSSLDWNQSSIDFYKAIGAKTKTGRVYFELDDEQTRELVARE